MFKLAAVGLCIVLFLKAQTIFLGGSNPSAMLQSLGLILAGPLLSIFLAHPMKTIRKLWGEAVSDRPCDPQEKGKLISEIYGLARVWQNASPRDLERANLEVSHPILRKGVDLVVDGYSAEDIRGILLRNFEVHISGKNARAAILSSLVKLTQSFGFIGTVVGLISVLNNLGGRAEIGPGVSVALFTTLYGLLFANFLYIPAHKKYLEKIRRECALFPIIIDGVCGMANRENARQIHYKLSCSFEQAMSEQKILVEPDLVAVLADERVFSAS